MSYEIKTLSEYQKQMQVFENSQDQMTLPELRLILRTDAHRFGPEWGKKNDPDYPLGESFMNNFIEVGSQLMNCGLKTVCAYIHGDEVSLLLDSSESSNSRKKSRLISLISSLAALSFFEITNKKASFYTKLSEIPNEERLIDYFFWQRKTASRNLISRNISILMEEKNYSKTDIGSILGNSDEAAQLKILKDFGRPIESFSSYERFGAFISWVNEEKDNNLNHIPKLEILKSLPESDSEYLNFLIKKIFQNGFNTQESKLGFSIETDKKSHDKKLKPESSEKVKKESKNTKSTLKPQIKDKTASFRLGRHKG